MSHTMTEHGLASVGDLLLELNRLVQAGMGFERSSNNATWLNNNNNNNINNNNNNNSHSNNNAIGRWDCNIGGNDSCSNGNTAMTSQDDSYDLMDSIAKCLDVDTSFNSGCSMAETSSMDLENFLLFDSDESSLGSDDLLIGTHDQLQEHAASVSLTKDDEGMSQHGALFLDEPSYDERMLASSIENSLSDLRFTTTLVPPSTTSVHSLNDALNRIDTASYKINWNQPSLPVDGQQRYGWKEAKMNESNRRRLLKGKPLGSKDIKTIRKRKNHKPRSKPNRCTHLYEFIEELLDATVSERCVEWVDEDTKEFRLTDTKRLAELWGRRKNSANMSYDKMSRTLRYYQKLDIIKKVEGKRLQFIIGEKCMWRKL